MNPEFIQKCISEVNPYDYKERKELGTYLSERIHAFTIQEDIPDFILPRDSGEELRYYQKWISFLRKNIFFGLNNYNKLDPLYDDSWSALQNAEYIDEQWILGADDKEFVEKITDNPLIYFSPLAAELRKQFHTDRYDVKLLDYDITKNPDAEYKKYIQYFKYTTDAITIMLEFWFNEEYTKNHTALIKRLNSETKIDTAEAWNKVKDLYSVSMQEDIAAKLQESFPVEAELVYTSISERNDLTEFDKFLSNFCFFKFIVSQDNSKINLKRAMSYRKAAKKSLEIIRNKPDLFIDNDRRKYFEEQSEEFEIYSKQLSESLKSDKNERGKRVTTHTHNSNIQEETFQKADLNLLISSFQMSRLGSLYSDIGSFLNQLISVNNNIGYSRSRQIHDWMRELKVELLYISINLEDYKKAERINSEYCQEYGLSPDLKTGGICPGIIPILKGDIEAGRKELLDFLESKIRDKEIENEEQRKWIAFVFDQVLTYVYPLNDKFNTLCKSLCGKIGRLLGKYYGENDEDKIIISEIYKGYVWYPGALNWFENKPEKKMSDETKERILLCKAQLYKWIYPRESIKIYQNLSKSKYLNDGEINDILSRMRTSFRELHDYIRVMKINQMENVTPEYEKLCIEQLEKELSVESVHSSSLAQEHWKKAAEDSLPILGIKNKDNKVNCSEPYRLFAVGLEQYLYSTVGKEIIAKLRKVKKSTSKIKLPKGWGSVVFGNDEKTIFLGTWEHLLDDLRKTQFSKFRIIISETVDEDTLTLISDCAAMLHVKRNTTSHGWFVMKSAAEFENEYKQIINKFNQLLMVFEKLGIEK